MKKLISLLGIFLVLLVVPVNGQNASYLDSVYQTLDTSPATDALTALKDSISAEFNVVIAEDQSENQNQWSLSYVQAIKEVLAVMPASFSAATRMVYLDPSSVQYEVKYVGFNDQHGIIQIGAGVMTPSVMYYRRYKELYNSTPSDAQLLARFKTILVRGMTYCYLQENPDLGKKYASIAAQPVLSTKVYSPAAETNMVVAPGKTAAWIDLAFAVSLYCTDPTTLQSKSSNRFDFVKTMVMNGESITGWDEKPVNGDGGNNNNDDDDDDDNGNPGGNVEPPATRPPPAIPDGDYMPVVTQVDVGTAAASLPAEHKEAPELLRSAIAELFSELPKFFSTCTEAIAYVPTTDTETAFSSEGFVFITQNSWFMPSFSDLDDAARGKRFKQTLMREMTLRFLYFHPEVTAQWKTTFDKNMSTYDAYVDMTQSAVLYYSAPAYLKQLNPERYVFIKTVVMIGKEFTE
ncbi:MAG: hypothetical protein PHD82_03090 [Candidatus Riflebacteria bacterium]|jgi:hypothetical protein|nr:hypothetical protein [Candidatus Riflebacteria bacterium]